MPILKLADRSPLIRTVLTRLIPWIPFQPLLDTKALTDVIDQTSRDIYAQKKRGLTSGNEDIKLGIEEGRDLMSVLRS